jgi:hypothetical protein
MQIFGDGHQPAKVGMQIFGDGHQPAKVGMQIFGDGHQPAKVGMQIFLLVRKSQIHTFLGSFRNRKSANF